MTTSPRPPQAPPGLTVGGYTLLSRLGEGGMGVVHLARRPGEERVALKVIRPHVVGDDEARARLAREVGSLSRIRSPRVAEIVDADPWGPVPYVATRYVPGLSLHDHVRVEGPLAGADLTWFARCLAQALAAVHTCGVLHRDVKPSNVLMEGRSPVLIDFGLARVADDPRLTHPGWLLGTPGFLAPEILSGHNATPASDVHAWAATVAYAGTGRPPYGGGPPMAVMDRIRRGEHRLDGLPTSVREVVEAALRPEPADRPGLAEILVRLDAPQTAPGPDTVPLAVACRSPVVPPAPLTRPLTLAAPGWPPTLAPVPVLPMAVRARRVALVLLLWLAAGAAVAAYPYLVPAGLLGLVWLLRSGSLAGSAAADRRQVRGSRWYDGPRLLLSTPWHLLASLPGTTMLVLWATGLAVAGGLLGYAFALPLAWSLLLAGVPLAAGLWLGPGGSRVRRPVDRVLRPAAARPGPWLVAALVLAALAAGAGALASERGVSWAPDDQAPLTYLW